MIPLQLQIKNFLSYGSEAQTIDFGPYNLICLSGRNGHGKSALLDAMTWAIWGEARKGSGISKPDQGLLRLGQRHMMVIFDFEFNCHKYRVRREFTFAYGKPYAFLEFGIFDGEKLMPLTDKTIRVTQEKIESMLGLNYDSFINSAFLRQGSSNEFSKKSPKERKDILATILGLDKFEILRKSALEKIRLSNIEKESICKLQEHIEKDLYDYDEIKVNLFKIKEQIDNISCLENENNKKIENLNNEKNIFLKKINNYQLLDFQLKKCISSKEEKTLHFYNLFKLWKDAHHQLIEFNNLKTVEIEKDQLNKKIEFLQQLQSKKLEFKEHFLKLKENEQILLNNLSAQYNAKLNEKKIILERIQSQKNNFEDKLNNLEKNKNDTLVELKKIIEQIKFIQLNIYRNSSIESEFQLNEKKFEKRKNYYQQLIAKGNWVKSELNSLEQKMKLSCDEQNPSCPLCEQNLSLSRKRFLKQQFTKQEKFYNHRFNRISNLIVSLKDRLLKQHEEINIQVKILEQNKLDLIKINDLEKNYLKLQQQIIDFDNEKNKIQKDLNLLVDKNEKFLKDIENSQQIYIEEVNQNSELLKIRSEITIIQKKLDENVYDVQENKKLFERLKDIQEILSAASNKNEIITQQQLRKKEISNLSCEIKSLKNEIKILEEKIKNFGDLESKEEQLKIEQIKLNELIVETAKTKEALLHSQGSLESQKNKLEKLTEEHKNQKKILLSIDSSIDEYKIISQALGKDGIQALLIEDAIPEIENEANELLSKLTDNQAQIFIESLRDLKKGGTKETLDIKISDGAGIRPYEMFSGGEAFRIDFALRIAISKLLARRAGTSLQTLIIDEGFGSQDEEGLNHIMDCLHKIQDDFAKIIVVSHLPSMKDQFPVHFFVEKGPAGSKINIIQQG